MLRTEFTVDWPVQGSACFRAGDSELLLSDVYWHWMYEALRGNDPPLPFVQAIDDGFADLRSDRETLPVTPALLDAVRSIDARLAPSFHRLQPRTGCVVPTPEEVLARFERVLSDALAAGTIEMIIDID